MKKVVLTIFTLTFLFTTSHSQEKNNEEKKIYEAKEIIFYGYDYTHFKIADAKRMDEDIKKFVFIWIGFCEEHITQKKLQNWLGKDKIDWNFDPTIALNKKLKSEDLGTPTKHSISKDSIQSYINEYNLREKEGIGFVINFECFDNAKKTVSAYYTFFDIATKKVLMTDYISSRDGNSYNRVSDWGTAVIINIKNYLPVYNDKKKLYKN